MELSGACLPEGAPEPLSPAQPDSTPARPAGRARLRGPGGGSQPGEAGAFSPPPWPRVPGKDGWDSGLSFRPLSSLFRAPRLAFRGNQS